MNTILIIDTYLNYQKHHKEDWLRYGINSIHVDTMSDAIIRLACGCRYLFVYINEDSIPNYLSHLPIMRDVTYIPILVYTSNFSPNKEFDSINAGADKYCSLSSSIYEDILGTIKEPEIQKRCLEENNCQTSIQIGGDIILSMPRRIVLINDKSVSLTTSEFNILFHLMNTNGSVMTYSQLYESVWGVKYKDSKRDELGIIVSRLKRKLRSVTKSSEYIKTIRNEGYCFHVDKMRKLRGKQH